MAIYDSTGALYIFDLENKELITIISSVEYDMYAFSGFTFLDENIFAYINKEQEICIFDMEKCSIVNKIKQDNISTIHADKTGKYLLAENWDCTYTVYDGKTFELLGTTPQVDTTNYKADPFLFADGTLACGYASGGDSLFSDYTMYFMDLNTMQTISSFYIGKNYPESMEIRDGIAYIACTAYEEDMLGSNAYLCAVDMASGSLIWEYEQKGYGATEVKLPANEGAKYLSFITTGNVILMDMQTGEVNFTVSTPSPVMESNVYQDKNNYLVICKDGEMLTINTEQGTEYDVCHLFECKTTSNVAIENYSKGIIVAGKNDNRVTFYSMQTGPDVVKTDKELAFPSEDHLITNEDATTIANEYGLEDPDFIDSLYYDESGKYCFIYYKDYSLLIYDVEGGQIIKTLDWAYPTWYCLGTDDRGYTYIMGYYGCYVLNEKMEPFMWIPEALDVDKENHKAYLSTNTGFYEAPIYSLEELIEMAKTQTAE